MISQFYVLSLRGDTIIFRDYLGNVQKVQCAGAHKPVHHWQEFWAWANTGYVRRAALKSFSGA